MADVFLSSARANSPQAAAIAAAVESGGRSVWWSGRSAAGEDAGGSAEHELDAARAVIVAWSAAARDSLWVRATASAALDGGRLVQVTLDGAAPPLSFAMAPAVDASLWSGRRGDPPWPAIEARLGDIAGSDSDERRPHAVLVPAGERPLQGFGQVALLGWTAIAAALLTGLFVVAAARGNVSGETLGIVSVVLLVLALGLLAVSAFIFTRVIRASRR